MRTSAKSNVSMYLMPPHARLDNSWLVKPAKSPRSIKRDLDALAGQGSGRDGAVDPATQHQNVELLRWQACRYCFVEAAWPLPVGFRRGRSECARGEAIRPRAFFRKPGSCSRRRFRGRSLRAPSSSRVPPPWSISCRDVRAAPSSMLGRIATRQSPLGIDLRPVRPVAGGEPRQIRGTESRRLGHLGHLDRHAENVGLELHQEAVARRAAVAAQLLQRDARILLHRLDDVARLVADRLQHRTHYVRPRRAARHAHQRAPRVRIPMRRAETDQSRHEVDAVIGLQRASPAPRSRLRAR